MLRIMNIMIVSMSLHDILNTRKRVLYCKKLNIIKRLGIQKK